MKKLNGREMKALFVLSVVVPVSLLTTLRLTGILQGPITISETTTLEAVKWEFSRRNETVILDSTLESSYSSEISAMMQALMGTYVNDDPAVGSDFITIGLTINVHTNMPHAFIESVYVFFSEIYEQSRVNWFSTGFYLENLSFMGSAEASTTKKDFAKAFVMLAGIDHPSSVYFSAKAWWKLQSPNTQTHQMGLFYELTYSNGTFYKKVVQPFQLTIRGE